MTPNLNPISPASSVRTNSQSLGNIGAALTVDLQGLSGQIFRVTANTAVGTITFANPVAGAEWIVEHRQDATGGRRTLFSGVTWLAGAGAVSRTANAVDVFNFYSPDGVTIYGFQATNPFYQPPLQASSGMLEVPGPRWMCTGSRGTADGTLFLTHFVADTDRAITTLVTALVGTLAATTTVAKMGLATYDGGNAYTTIARTANDTTLWSGAVGFFARAVADDGQGNAIGNVQLVAGREYAHLIFFHGTTPPQLGGASMTTNVMGLPDGAGKLKRAGLLLAAQTDIPATLTVSNGNSTAYWMGMY